MDLCLRKLEDWLEGFDADELDFASPDGVVTLEFADGTRFVVNRQAAAEQVWFAAGARAWHYTSSDGDDPKAPVVWTCDKDGHELFARIAEAVSEKLGRTVEF